MYKYRTHNTSILTLLVQQLVLMLLGWFKYDFEEVLHSPSSIMTGVRTYDLQQIMAAHFMSLTTWPSVTLKKKCIATFS